MELSSNKTIENILLENEKDKNIKTKIENLKNIWITTKKKIKIFKNKNWKQQIIKNNYKNRLILYNFREKLKKFIIKRCNLCIKKVCSKCESVGSTKLTSDIDITIKSELHFNISIIKLILLLNDFKNIFKDEKKFHKNGKFKLKLVHIFFDINFYITNFELPIKKITNANFNKLESYYISKCYFNSCQKNVVNQYFFAFFEFYKKIKKPLNVIKYKKKLTEYISKTNELNNLLKDKYVNESKIINMISILSLYQEESYHTQGSYFHVVMMNQKKIFFKINDKNKQILQNLLSVSIIENLCFAYINSKKKIKYIMRVKDGLHRLHINNINTDLFKSLIKNINTNNEFDNIILKKEIQILSKKLINI